MRSETRERRDEGLDGGHYLITVLARIHDKQVVLGHTSLTIT